MIYIHMKIIHVHHKVSIATVIFICEIIEMMDLQFSFHHCFAIVFEIKTIIQIQNAFSLKKSNIFILITVMIIKLFFSFREKMSTICRSFILHFSSNRK